VFLCANISLTHVSLGSVTCEVFCLPILQVPLQQQPGKGPLQGQPVLYVLGQSDGPPNPLDQAGVNMVLALKNPFFRNVYGIFH
jgi:hypothetical protein